MRVRLRDPYRKLEVVGGRPVRNVLEGLGIATDRPVELFEGAAP